MKFTRELSARLVIRSVSEAVIRVNEDSYTESIALTPDELLGPWQDTRIADLSEADFSAILDTCPEIVLLGTGVDNVFPPRELTFAFARKGVGFETMDTAAAARTFNVLANEGRKVAAVLYL
ncbi:MAG: Mth938-like domain-containing protein [Gammaproteobacteria bacterium]|nr:Mth938-like domain-containing protein [Gammaproteobacteria bacterium]